jgi:bisphosphoglycerate-independent phosphoglycerate mutase (AlkP superfamily)
LAAQDGTVYVNCVHECGQDGDAVVIFNFRADRVVELSKAFEYKDFKAFDRKRYPDVRRPHSPVPCLSRAALSCLPSVCQLPGSA